MAPKIDSLMLLGFWLLVILPTAHACVEGRGLAAAGKWDYNRCNEATGGKELAAWGDAVTGSFCGAANVQQSPVNICGATRDPELLLGTDKQTWTDIKRTHTVKNNGHTVQITLDPIPLRPTMTNTLATKVGRTAETAPQTWRLEQLHFHWGRKGKKNEGSEHYLLNKPYTMEGHFVHYNAKYADVAAAVASGNKDALLVIGVMFQVGATATGGTLVADIASSIAALTTTAEAPLTTAKGTFAELAALSGIVRSDTALSNFFAYPGSLTTPTCNEDVTWVVMEAPMTVTQATMDKFYAAKALSPPTRRRLTGSGETARRAEAKDGLKGDDSSSSSSSSSSHGGSKGRRLDHAISRDGNFRPLQDIGARKILTAGGSQAACGAVGLLKPKFDCTGAAGAAASGAVPTAAPAFLLQLAAVSTALWCFAAR